MKTPFVRVLTATVAAAVVLGGCGQAREHVAGSGSDGGGNGSCAALLEYAGHRYYGHGELKRDPTTTGRVDTGTVPGCDDGNGAPPQRRVEVDELSEVPMARAVLVDGQLYVRADRPLPEAVRGWFRPPGCSTPLDFEVRGDWLGMQGVHEPRFDGDLRPPYRVEVHVTDGPEEYLGARIKVLVTDATRPGLGPDDVRTSLHQGGDLVAEVRCADGRFVATAPVQHARLIRRRPDPESCSAEDALC